MKRLQVFLINCNTLCDNLTLTELNNSLAVLSQENALILIFFQSNFISVIHSWRINFHNWLQLLIMLRSMTFKISFPKFVLAKHMNLREWARADVATELTAAIQQLTILILKPADENGNLYDVFENYIIWSYQTVITTSLLWKVSFKNTSY